MPARAHPSCRFYWVLWPEADSNRPHGIILHCHACPCTFRPFATQAFPNGSVTRIITDIHLILHLTNIVSLYVPVLPALPGFPVTSCKTSRTLAATCRFFAKAYIACKGRMPLQILPPSIQRMPSSPTHRPRISLLSPPVLAPSARQCALSISKSSYSSLFIFNFSFPSVVTPLSLRVAGRQPSRHLSHTKHP